MAKDIKVALELDNSQFQRSINQSKNSVKDFEQTGSRSLSNLRNAFLALGGAAVIKGITDTGAAFQDLQNSLNVVFGGVEQGAAAFERVQGFAASTQFSVQTLTQAFVQLKGAGVEPTEQLLQTFADTASVTTDQMGTFQAALDLVSRSTAGGLGLEDLNRLADRGIPVFNILKDRLGLARLEVSEFGKTSEGANLIVRELIAGLNQKFGGALQNQVGLLNFELNQLGDAFDKLKVALFGTFDQEAAQAVQGLTAAINRLADNVEPILKLGKGLAQLAAVVTLIFPMARALRAASTAMFSLTRGTSIFAAGGPGFIKTVSNIGKSVKDFITKPFEAARKAISRLFKEEGPDDILSNLGRLKLAAQKVGEGFLWLGGTTLGFLGLKNAVEGANDVVEQLADNFVGPPRKLFDDEVKRLIDEYNELTDNDTLFDPAPTSLIPPETKTALQEFLDYLDDVKPALSTFEQEYAKLQETLGQPQTVKEIKDFDSALGALRDAFGVNDELDKLVESFENIESIEQYNEKLAALTGLLNSGKIGATEFETAKEQLDEALGDNEELISFISTLNQATDTLSDDLASALMEGKSAMDSFKSFFKTLVQQVIADALKLLLIIPILEAIGFSTMGGSITGLSGKGFLGSLGFKQTGIGGGNLMPNRPVLVGEAGPEIFYPASSGSLSPNAMATQVTYNINAVDAPSFQALVARDPEFIYSVTRAGAKRLPGAR